MMIPRELKIKELEKLLLKELYEEYRKKPGAMPDGNDYYEYIKEKYKSDYNISRNDFIISLEHMANRGCVKLEKTTDSIMPLFFTIKPRIIDDVERLSDSFSNTVPRSFKQVSEKFIEFNFSDYGLHHYDSFVDLINKAVVFDDFYKVTPFLLRCLFENLLYDIFQSSLQNHHKELYFMKAQNRARNFSQLINLLDLLKDNAYKHIIRDSINPKTIEILEKIKKIGNYTVHDVIEKVSKNDVNELNDDIHLALKPLLACYQKLGKEKIKIKDDQLIKIKQKFGLFHQEDDDTGEFEVEKEDYVIKVDFSLVELYSDMIDKGEVSPDNIISILGSINNQLENIRYVPKIDQDDLSIIEKLCLTLKRLIKSKDSFTMRRILDILDHLKQNKSTEEILKKNFFETIQKFFKAGEVYNDVIRILDHFGYFQDILKFLIEAIENNDLNQLKAYHSNINFSKYKVNRLEILKELRIKTNQIKSTETDLKEITQKIIRRFENIK